MSKLHITLIIAAIVFLVVLSMVLIGECAIRKSNLGLQQQKFKYEQQQDNKSGIPTLPTYRNN